MRLKFAAIYILAALSFSLMAHRADARNRNLFSGGFSYANYEVTGSDYKSKSQSEFMLAGQYSYVLGQRWRFVTNFSGTLDAQTFTASSGVAYHLNSLMPKVDSPNDSIEYTVIPTFSPYLGVEMAFTRIQLSLVRTGSSQTDAVIGALVGPQLKAGSFYTINDEWILDFEAALGYAFSSAVASSNTSFLVRAIYLIP